MARRVHFAIERLSPEGLTLVHRGLREKWTYTKIVKEVSAATGEKVAHSSLGRYAAKRELEMRSVQESQDQARAILAEFKAGDMEIGDVATALLAQALADTKEALKKADPIAVSYAQTARERIDLKRMEIELRKQELAFNERKLEAMEKKLAAVKEKAEKVSELVERNAELSEETKRAIREGIYGLTQ